MERATSSGARHKRLVHLAGETLSRAEDFFQPVHTEHLADWSPQGLPYLALPPGWRFLLAPGQENGWYDASLLEI